jgi:hypothetical protein
MNFRVGNRVALLRDLALHGQVVNIDWTFAIPRVQVRLEITREGYVQDRVYDFEESQLVFDPSRPDANPNAPAAGAGVEGLAANVPPIVPDEGDVAFAQTKGLIAPLQRLRRNVELLGGRPDKDALRALTAKRLFATDPRIINLLDVRAEQRDADALLEQAWLYAMRAPFDAVERIARRDAEDRAGKMFPIGEEP